VDAKHGRGTLPGCGEKINDHEVDGVLSNDRLIAADFQETPLVCATHGALKSYSEPACAAAAG